MILQFGLLVFPNVQQLDRTGPYAVFASVPEAKVHLVWKDRSAIPSSSGLALTPTMPYGECPAMERPDCGDVVGGERPSPSRAADGEGVAGGEDLGADVLVPPSRATRARPEAERRARTSTEGVRHA